MNNASKWWVNQKLVSIVRKKQLFLEKASHF